MTEAKTTKPQPNGTAEIDTVATGKWTSKQ